MRSKTKLNIFIIIVYLKNINIFLDYLFRYFEMYSRNKSFGIFVVFLCNIQIEIKIITKNVKWT